VAARRAAAYVAVALAACTLLAARSAAVRHISADLDRTFFLGGFDERLSWVALYYLTWIALTPAIFWSARRYPIRRDQWAGPALVHGLASQVVPGVVMVALSVVFGELVLDRGWANLSDLLTPRWFRLALVHAFTDSLIYLVILGAGHGFALYDAWQARRLQAAELERSLVAAQVDSLKMKLQPHFLFNTLNSISFLAIEGETSAISTMVERLGSLLRASMSSNGRQWIPLDDELALLDQYLSIEELRFRDRLRVTRRIAPAARGARVPSLVLQPIVENSIKHGFSKRLDASRLDIEVARDDEWLVVRITDDGPGLAPGWTLDTHCGRGLRNVIERLAALYRGAFSFALTNAPGGGALAELRIPYDGTRTDAASLHVRPVSG
jgi:signal transduction histidine kinase